jgi:hypothetical protein
MTYKEFIFLSKDQIKIELDETNNRLYELICTRKYFFSPHRDAQEKQLKEKIECLIQALQYKSDNGEQND